MAHLIEQMAYVGQTPWHGTIRVIADLHSVESINKKTRIIGSLSRAMDQQN